MGPASTKAEKTPRTDASKNDRGAQKAGEKTKPAASTPTAKGATAAEIQPPAAAGDPDPVIEQWVAMWQAIGKAADDAGGDCDTTAAAWTTLFKANKAVFRETAKRAEAQGEDELTVTFAKRIEEPTGRFMAISKQCRQSKSMTDALSTMNAMYE